MNGEVGPCRRDGRGLRVDRKRGYPATRAGKKGTEQSPGEAVRSPAGWGASTGKCLLPDSSDVTSSRIVGVMVRQKGGMGSAEVTAPGIVRHEEPLGQGLPSSVKLFQRSPCRLVAFGRFINNVNFAPVGWKKLNEVPPPQRHSLGFGLSGGTVTGNRPPFV
jgi:hypothetical protein